MKVFRLQGFRAMAPVMDLPPALQPVMMGPVHLDHLAQAVLALPPEVRLLAEPPTLPQPLVYHDLPNLLWDDLDPGTFLAISGRAQKENSYRAQPCPTVAPGVS